MANYYQILAVEGNCNEFLLSFEGKTSFTLREALRLSADAKDTVKAEGIPLQIRVISPFMALQGVKRMAV